jgi:hypothetical protein
MSEVGSGEREQNIVLENNGRVTDIDGQDLGRADLGEV